MGKRHPVPNLDKKKSSKRDLLVAGDARGAANHPYDVLDGHAEQVRSTCDPLRLPSTMAIEEDQAKFDRRATKVARQAVFVFLIWPFIWQERFSVPGSRFAGDCRRLYVPCFTVCLAIVADQMRPSSLEEERESQA